jgi:undecaprenyl-diphosphatase
MMGSEIESATGPGGSSRRNPRAAGTGFALEYTLGIILGCLAVAGFIWIAIVVARGAVLPLDAAGLRWARSTRSPQAIAAALEITALGSLPTILLVLLLATIFFANRRSGAWQTNGLPPRGNPALLLWLAAIGGAALNIVLKSYFARPRPPITTAVHAGFFAFPSGHAMSSMVVYGTLAYLIARDTPGATTRALTISFAVVVILVIGLSRIYLGVHYATDVLGGYLAGFAWADLCVLLYEAGRWRRHRAGRRAGPPFRFPL